MSELSKAVGQLMLNNLSMTVIIIILVVSGIFKLLFKTAKREIDPLRWIAGKIGQSLTREVRKDIQDFKVETHDKFEELKNDYDEKISSLRNDVAVMKEDTNRQISKLQTDLDNFETRTNKSIDDMKSGTVANCETLKKRLDEMEAAQQKSNDMQTIQTIRAHILSFANSCFNKQKHTKQEFENVIDENARYEELIAKYHIKNNIYKEDYGFVMKCYHKCQEEGTFLKEGD